MEAGKRYADRRGRVYGPLVANHALFGECRENYTWSIDGRVSQCSEYDIDLVAEYVEPDPLESPDDWVTQDRVPARVGVDSQNWMPMWGEGKWRDITHGDAAKGKRHGYVDGMRDKLSLRCRRKDLPPVPPKTRTVVLKEWICWDDDYPEAVVIQWFSTDPSVNAGLAAEYGHAVATGNTRTVEIPVT